MRCTSKQITSPYIYYIFFQLVLIFSIESFGQHQNYYVEVPHSYNRVSFNGAPLQLATLRYCSDTSNKYQQWMVVESPFFLLRNRSVLVLISKICYFDESHTKSALLLHSSASESDLGMKNPTPLKGGFHIGADSESDSKSRSGDLRSDLRADSNSEA